MQPEDKRVDWHPNSPETMNKSCNVLIYGSGAVGSIFGWRIAQQSNARVSVVCRSNYESVKQAGFFLQTKAWGDGHFVPYQVFRAQNFSQRPPKQHFDYVICANKFTTDISVIIKDLRQVVGPGTALVSAQNGMDVEMPLKRAFPRNTVLSAICNVGCMQDRPGHIQQNAGMNPMAFLIGSIDGTLADIQRRDALAAFDSRFASIEDVVAQRWKKLIFNGTWNATSALTNLDTQQVFQQPSALRLATSLASEASKLARSAGVNLDAKSVIDLAKTSSAITPSTLQDARNKRPMEITSIWGYLVSQASLSGIDVPVTNTVYELLQQMNRSFALERSVDAGRHFEDSLRTVPKMPNISFNPPSWLDSHTMSQNGMGVALAS